MTLRVISLGAGVQSTTMALMAAHGEIGPMPDCAIFADTGWEPKAVYDHLGKLELPFPIIRVAKGDLRAAIMARPKYDDVPWYVEGGMGRRQCTHQYKLRPIRRQVRDMLGGTPKHGAEMWIGISIDEAMRCKPSSVQYIRNRWPLLEQRMNRNDCLRWLERNGYPTPPKSACIGCPFHNDAQWRDLRQRPDEWADALEVDAAIRPQFMHRSLKPLDQVDLSTVEDHGQLNLFNNECEGMCGV
jgi:hypothetical protein